MYRILYSFLWLITLLPLPVLYLLSDFSYLIIYYVVGYRENVVRKNLRNSFPDKSLKELKRIEKQFYHYFCDLFIETIYEIHMTKDEIAKRFVFKNVDLIMEQYAKSKSVLVMTSHYCNWEWASSLSLFLPKDKILYGVYKKLTNANFDRLMYELRMKFTGKNIETQDLFRTMLRIKNDGELCTYGMISDQTPTAKATRHWMTFLNQDTPVLVGTEQLAKKFDFPVLYFECRRLKRGYYSCEFIPIALEPKKTAEFEITEKYIHLLEKTIMAEPQFWLWTHKRWKHKRPADQELS